MQQHDKRRYSVRAFLVAGVIGAITLLGSQQGVAAGSCQADVVFLMDNTGSMGSMISSTRTNAATILNAISGGDERFEGIDVQYGLATYWGDPLEYKGGSSSSYHFPVSTEYSGRVNDIELISGVSYYLDMIDTWGDGWNNSLWNLSLGSSTSALPSVITWLTLKALRAISGNPVASSPVSPPTGQKRQRTSELQ